MNSPTQPSSPPQTYLTQLLGRVPEVLPLKNGKYIVAYFSYGAPASQFVGDTEEQALERLAEYLKSKTPLEIDGEKEPHGNT